MIPSLTVTPCRYADLRAGDLFLGAGPPTDSGLAWRLEVFVRSDELDDGTPGSVWRIDGGLGVQRPDPARAEEGPEAVSGTPGRAHVHGPGVTLNLDGGGPLEPVATCYLCLGASGEQAEDMTEVGRRHVCRACLASEGPLYCTSLADGVCTLERVQIGKRSVLSHVSEGSGALLRTLGSEILEKAVGEAPPIALTLAWASRSIDPGDTVLSERQVMETLRDLVDGGEA